MPPPVPKRAPSASTTRSLGLVLWASLALAGCAASGAGEAADAGVALVDEGTAPAPERVERMPLLPLATGPLELAPSAVASDDPDRESWRLDDVVRRYAQVVALEVTIDPACAEQLAAQHVDLGRSLRIEQDRVQGFVEALLDAYGYVLVWTAGERSEGLRVTQPDEDDPGWLEAAALRVPPERVEDLRPHAALLVATEVELPATDVARTCAVLDRELRRLPAEAILPIVDVDQLPQELEALAPRRHRDPDTGRYDTIELADVPAGTIAARCGVQSGDRLKSIDGRPVTSVAEAIGHVKETTAERDRWTIVVERRGREVTLVVSEHAVLVLGTGRRVAERVALLRELDALNAALATEEAR